MTKSVSNNHKVWVSIPLGKKADPSLDVNLDELPVDRALRVWTQSQTCLVLRC